MRIIIQRVSEASVSINHHVHSAIQNGLLVLVGFEHEDTIEDIKWISLKLMQLRIFGDENGKMNLSVADINGSLLVVSQFTLHASTQKGNRPSFIKAASPEIAIPLYDYFIHYLQTEFTLPIKSGVFGADMKVSLINDGPVTIIIDSKRRE